MVVPNALKSPPLMAAVGMVPVRVADVVSYVPSQAPKKNSLFLMMGPPRVAPSMLRWLGILSPELKKLRARNFFNSGDKIPSHRNIDGATLGGPIIKNKLFFFGAWEGTYETTSATRTGTMPTAAMRGGDFSAFGTTIYDPATGNPDGSGRTPFANNVIPANRISPIAQ